MSGIAGGQMNIKIKHDRLSLQKNTEKEEDADDTVSSIADVWAAISSGK